MSQLAKTIEIPQVTQKHSHRLRDAKAQGQILCDGQWAPRLGDAIAHHR